MPKPPKKEVSTEGEISENTLIWHNPCNVDKEDNPDNWDDTNEDTWSMESDNMAMIVQSVSNPISRMLQQKSETFADNHPLHLMQVKMDRLRSATDLARVSVKPDNWRVCTINDSRWNTNDWHIKFINSRVRNHKKLTHLFGPLELIPPITPPSIMIRQGNITSRYVRDLSRNDTLELNDCYLFKRIASLSLESESIFCFNLAPTTSRLKGGTILSSASQRATLSEGNQVDVIPNLLEEINDNDDENMVLLHTRKKNNKGVLSSLTIYFERRGLFLKNIVIRSIELTPLRKQPLTIQLVIEFADLYDLRNWRSNESTSRLSIINYNMKDETTKKWNKWKLSDEGLRARQMFKYYVMQSPLYLNPIVDILFSYSCESICGNFRFNQRFTLNRYLESRKLRMLSMEHHLCMF